MHSGGIHVQYQAVHAKDQIPTNTFHAIGSLVGIYHSLKLSHLGTKNTLFEWSVAGALFGQQFYTRNLEEGPPFRPPRERESRCNNIWK